MTFRWTVEFEVDELWVADGFNLTAERAKDMIERALPHSYAPETAARIISAPGAEAILKAQGYKVA
jgi:hypothetical protein